MGVWNVGIQNRCYQRLFRLPLREGVAKAKEMGAHGIQVYAVEGELCPENMDIAARQDFRRFVNNTGLEIAALCGDLGGHGFQLAEENAIKVPRSKAIVDLAVDLGGNVVTTHIGVVPGDRRAILMGSCATPAVSWAITPPKQM